MAIANRPYGRVLKGHTIPYGTLANASPELRMAYYSTGYVHDEDMPPLPCPPPDLDEPYICPEEELLKKEIAAALNEVLDGLTPRASKVLRLRFGFDGGHEMTLEEVGKAFHVGKERARQIEAKAIRLLKHPQRKLHDLLWPETQEEVIIKGKHAQRMYEESRERLEAQREEQRKRTVKQKLVHAYREGDTSWLDYLAREEPEIYAQMQERIKLVLAKYE